MAIKHFKTVEQAIKWLEKQIKLISKKHGKQITTN